MGNIDVRRRNEEEYTKFGTRYVSIFIFPPNMGWSKQRILSEVV